MTKFTNKQIAKRTSLAQVNPLVTNELSHSYQLDESTFIFRGIGSKFHFYFFDEICVCKQNSPDGTPRFAASHLGLVMDTRLIWVIWANSSFRKGCPSATPNELTISYLNTQSVKPLQRKRQQKDCLGMVSNEIPGFLKHVN